MSNLSKPLSYESLKAVLQHVDFNLRLLLAQKLPSIRPTEKVTPCKFKNLVLTRASISINGIRYTVSIVNFYPDEGFLKYDGQDCNTYTDVNKYGKKCEVEQPEFLIEESHVRANVRNCQSEMETRGENFWFTMQNEKYWSRSRDAFLLQRDQEVPPFTNFLRFTVQDGAKSRNEHFEYRGTIRVYLFQRLLGARKGSIQVKTLQTMDDGHLVLPAGVKFDVKHLEGMDKQYSNGFEKLRPFLILPLKSITVYKHEIEDPEILHLARKVIITRDHHSGTLPPSTLRRVRFTGRMFDEDLLWRMLQIWRRDHPEVGAHVSFAVNQSYLTRIAKRTGEVQGVEVRKEVGTTFFHPPNVYVFPLNNESEVSITLRNAYDSDSNMFDLIMKVRPIGMVPSPSLPEPSSLSEHCLRVVVQNMDADFRLALSQKIPTVRLISEKTSLRVKNLAVSPVLIELDTTHYELVVKRYDQEVQGYKRAPNSEDKLDYDVDRYGIRIPRTGVLSGDLDFGKEEETLKSEDEILKDVETELNTLKEQRNANRLAKEKFYIRQQECERYFLRRDKLEPQYKFFLELTVLRRGFKTMERVEYCQNLAVAQKYMMRKILEQSGQILVKNLTISDSGTGLIRTPENLKVSAKNLTVYKNGSDKPLSEILAPIIFRPSRFESIGVDKIHKNDYHFLKHSQKVAYIRNSHGPLPAVPYQNMFLTSVTSEQVLMIAKEWKEKKRVVGTHFSFWICAAEKHKAMELMINEPEANMGELQDEILQISPVRYSLCVILPIDDQSEINIYQTKVPWGMNRNHSRAPTHHSTSDDCLEMWIRPKGFAKKFEI